MTEKTRTHTILLPAASLAHREIIRFLRQKNRVLGALATPILFWIIIGAGMGTSFHAHGMPGQNNFIEFFFPGTLVMILLFTAVFSTISIIEDRREGFLQAVLAAPPRRSAIVLGKVTGATALAVAQAAIFLPIASVIGITLTPQAITVTLAVMVLLAFSLACLGFCIAWRMSSAQGFHAVMNLLLMPMWFLSGALFPAQGAMGWIEWIMRINPLTYGVAAVRRAMYWPMEMDGRIPSMTTSLLVSAAFAVIMFLLATALASRRRAEDLA